MRRLLALLLAGCGDLAPNVTDVIDASVDVQAQPTCIQASPTSLAETSESFGVITSIGVRAPLVYWTEDDGAGGVLHGIASDGDGGNAITLGACDRFAIDGDNAFCFVLASSSITKVPLDGSTVTTLASSPSSSLHEIVADSGNVYVADCGNECENGTTIWTVPENGGALAPFVTGNSLWLYAANAGNVYWTSNDGAYGDLLTTIHSTTTNGVSTSLATLPDHVDYVALNDTDVFINGHGTDGAPAPDNTIWKVPRAGGATTIFASSVWEFAIAADDTFVYAATAAGNVAIPIAGGNATTLPLVDHVDLMALDDLYLYGVTNTDSGGALYRTCK